MITSDKNYSFDEVLALAMRYCAYQERCIHELQQKNLEWELGTEDFDKLIQQLKNDNFINEERYVQMYVKGKFEQKKWGKYKIRHSLILKGLSLEFIEQALQNISELEYQNSIQFLLQRKNNELFISDPNRKAKLFNYLQSKGYESDVFYEILEAFLKDNQSQ